MSMIAEWDTRYGTWRDIYCHDCDDDVTGKVVAEDNYEQEVVCPGCRQSWHVSVID